MPGNPLWAAFSSTLGFAEFAATLFDHYHPSESLEPAERSGLQASACMSSELLAELRELRSELAQLRNRALLLESQGQVSSVLGNPPMGFWFERFSPWKPCTDQFCSASCFHRGRPSQGI